MAAAGAGTLRTGGGTTSLAAGCGRACGGLRTVIARRSRRQTTEGVASDSLLLTIHRDPTPVRPSKHAATGDSCGLMSDFLQVDLLDRIWPWSLDQCRTKVTGCDADLSPKDGGQVALVGEANFLCDHSQRAIGSAHQSFCSFDPPVHHVALGSHPNRLLEAAAEVVGTETCHPGEIHQGQPIIEMRLDVVIYALQPLARQSVCRLNRDRGRITAESRNLHRERRVERIGQNMVEETTLHFVGNCQHEL